MILRRKFRILHVYIYTLQTWGTQKVIAVVQFYTPRKKISKTKSAQWNSSWKIHPPTPPHPSTPPKSRQSTTEQVWWVVGFHGNKYRTVHNPTITKNRKNYNKKKGGGGGRVLNRNMNIIYNHNQQLKPWLRGSPMWRIDLQHVHLKRRVYASTVFKWGGYWSGV